ncbi:MAG: hypothetical protein JWM86_875 [Thermoleophilia bacterium]|nr:hypothetical protein [Thermoleophilia bacterium]
MQLTPIRNAIDDPGTPPPSNTFPVEAVDKARGLLSDAQVLVKGMIATGSLNQVSAARRDALAAARLLSTATNVAVPFSREMSLATSNALDAASALAKVLDSLKYIDNGLGQTFAYKALGAADKLLDKAYDYAMTATHP